MAVKMQNVGLNRVKGPEQKSRNGNNTMPTLVGFMNGHKHTQTIVFFQGGCWLSLSHFFILLPPGRCSHLIPLRPQPLSTHTELMSFVTFQNKILTVYKPKTSKELNTVALKTKVHAKRHYQSCDSCTIDCSVKEADAVSDVRSDCRTADAEMLI